MSKMNLNVGLSKLKRGTNINEVEVPDVLRQRKKVGISWIDDALGGDGFVPSSVMMLTGTPGAGKTTLMLQMANAITKSGHICLYNTGGFFTPTGVGTVVANGKEERIINGKRMILEAPLTADYAIIRARVGDPFGNLRFYKTARNFSPLMAMASRICVVEVEELVSLGDLGPDDIHLPGLYVQRLFVGKGYEDPIEKLTVRPRPVPAGV